MTIWRRNNDKKRHDTDHQTDIPGRPDRSDSNLLFLAGRRKPADSEPEIEPTDTGCVLSVTLTQEQTLAFEPGALYFQIRAVKDGEAVASKVWRYFVADVKPDGEITEALSVTPGAITPDPDATIDDPYENI